ncbi:MAG: 4Fe-4S binding protein [Chloroflexi bacterium]|nr:4Fe-4S binding protein [Chloroflexota bacterium]
MAKTEGELTWKDLEIGSIVTEPGNATQYRTGDWRSQHPTYDFSKCIKCGICYMFCPEGCIGQNKQGYFEADMYYCKGCGICAKECPTKVITMVDEEE